MVSRRKFISMTMMMLVLLFMFQFTQVIKDMDNRYNVNEYAGESAQSGSTAWKMSDTGQEETAVQESVEYVVYYGNPDSEIGQVVYQWCLYTKRDMLENLTLDEMKEYASSIELLLIDSSYVDWNKDIKKLTKLANQGVSMVFCNLPDSDVLEASEEAMDLLGIRSVEASEVELQGIKLFEGFLLGGETVYEVKEPEDALRQDLDFHIPYYVVFGGTKTYMVGMLSDESIENEYLPAIIWRNSYGDARIFAVNGDYMCDSTGIGILDAMMAEIYPYELYPVINAQNLSIANFPGFAEENSEELMRLYSRTPSGLYRDIMWPSITATTGKSLLNETLFFMAEADYSDGNTPQTTDYVFYLKEMKEHGAEAGVSLSNRSEMDLKSKVETDASFYNKANDGYTFTAAYLDDNAEREEILEKNLLQASYLENIKTMVQKYSRDTKVVSYVTSDVTLLSTTCDGFDYTFSQDLRMRSLQTALGYSNILLDMYVLTWPEDTGDTWENMSDSFARNVNTFWAPFQIFDNTTISETDARARNMLNLDYEHSSENNMITLRVDNFHEEAWFILKTNNSILETISGAEAEEIEENAYLLRITSPQVRIQLKNKDVPYYYIP